MTWPIVDLAFWNPGQPGSAAIDALLAESSVSLARHGLTGIAAAYARETGAVLHDAHRRWAHELNLCSLAVDGALTEVVPLLAGAGVDFFVAKGPVIAYRDYPDPSMRPYCDLDIYVAGRHVADARSLLAEHGYTPVDHAVGVLGGLAQEMHGGRFSAVVEVHAHPIDNLHRHHLPPVEAFLEHVERVELCGVKVPVLSPAADLALQAIHLAAGHRYAKLALLRDIGSGLDRADHDVLGRLGAAPYMSATAAVLAQLGRPVPGRPLPTGVLERPMVAALIKRGPLSWDEYRLSTANVLAVFNQGSWRTTGRCIAWASRSLLPSSNRRVSTRAPASLRSPRAMASSSTNRAFEREGET